MATLIINPSDSRCGACGRGCMPFERRHETVLGYNVSTETGCLELFSAVGTSYWGEGIAQAARAMRPDLPWAGIVT